MGVRHVTCRQILCDKVRRPQLGTPDSAAHAPRSDRFGGRTLVPVGRGLTRLDPSSSRLGRQEPYRRSRKIHRPPRDYSSPGIRLPDRRCSRRQAPPFVPERIGMHKQPGAVGGCDQARWCHRPHVGIVNLAVTVYIQHIPIRADLSVYADDVALPRPALTKPLAKASSFSYHALC